ncbi:hypothetical protein [Thalassotalea sp. ND16A]|uniref:hypothetical protein n=1 Tax=Thalassotalea sp. ND16A TaxID=1535422 RepID=UPI00051A1216|nr:hypothetical protein [Thalassotalea sp. ND16A]KGK00279.1 hypothetical protein ND16A_3615 [Thalassotalea sp. ND16A]
MSDEMARQDTTIAINGARKDKLKDAVVDITIATREPIKSSAIVQYLIDNYLDDAVKDLKNQLK